MDQDLKIQLNAAAERLCRASEGLAASAYALSEDVKTATPALREAASIGVWTGGNPALAGREGRTAVLVLAFGTTYRETRAKTIEAVEDAIRRAHPGLPVFEAYTSHIIIDRVWKKEGIRKLTPEEALERLAVEGYTRAAVVSLDIIPGLEYDYNRLAVRRYADRFQALSLSTPLMYYQGTEGRPDQVVEFLRALSGQLPPAGPEEAVLLMAHGTPHPANAYYAVIQDRIRELGLNHLFVYSVEGRPDLDDVIPRLKETGIRRVTLMPIMLVAGDHAVNDMAGPDPDSHKSRLEAEGFAVSAWLHGLGENPAVRALYVKRADEAVAALRTLCPTEK